jgi:hypothetical protein
MLEKLRENEVVYERLEPLLKALQKAQRNLLGEIDYIDNVRNDITGDKMPLLDLKHWTHQACATVDRAMEGPTKQENLPGFEDKIDRMEIRSGNHSVVITGDVSEKLERAARKLKEQSESETKSESD